MALEDDCVGGLVGGREDAVRARAPGPLHVDEEQQQLVRVSNDVVREVVRPQAPSLTNLFEQAAGSRGREGRGGEQT